MVWLKLVDGSESRGAWERRGSVWAAIGTVVRTWLFVVGD